MTRRKFFVGLFAPFVGLPQITPSLRNRWLQWKQTERKLIEKARQLPRFGFWLYRVQGKAVAPGEIVTVSTDNPIWISTDTLMKRRPRMLSPVERDIELARIAHYRETVPQVPELDLWWRRVPSGVMVHITVDTHVYDVDVRFMQEYGGRLIEQIGCR
jgi:hypothetical protein